MTLIMRWYFWWPLVLVVGFFWPFAERADSQVWHDLQDYAHLFAFFILSFSCYALLCRFHVTHAKRFVPLICVLIIFAVEIIQPMVGRTASWVDVQFGLLGVGVWWLWQAWSTRVRGGQRAALVVMLLVVVIVPGWSALQGVYSLVWRWQQAPILGDFESSLDLHLWRAYGRQGDQRAIAIQSADQSRHGSYSLLLQTLPKVWSGVRYEAGDRDWSAYQRLNFSIYLAGAQSAGIGMRIDDQRRSPEYAQRVNIGLKLQPGWNDISMDMAELDQRVQSRTFDWTAVRYLYFFVSPEQSALQLYIDNVYLQ
ncbi:MAG: VanZ family protein [Gammaproteobacteria bacterium]|nr:VanZ family protein [Gammaproteobacteria bacterium]